MNKNSTKNQIVIQIKKPTFVYQMKVNFFNCSEMNARQTEIKKI